MKLKSLILMFCAAVALMSVSCQKKEYVLELDRSVINFEADGNDPEEVTVTSQNLEWTVNVDEASREWLMTATSGDKIFVTAIDRTVETPRVGRIVVRAVGDVAPAKEIVVTQKGATGVVYSLSISPRTLVFAADETDIEKKVFVTARNTGWSADVEEAAREWLTISTGSDEIAVKVKEKKDTGSRTGRIVVRPEREDLTTQYVTVTQTGISVSLNVSPTELSFGAEDTEVKTVTVTARNVEWNAEVEEGAQQWLKISVSGNTVGVSVERNEDDKPRVGKVLVIPDMTGITPKEVLVTQGSMSGQYDAVFFDGNGEYYGDFYENGCGNFDLRLVSGDLELSKKGMVTGGTNGYYLFCENLSDLAQGSELYMSSARYDINGSMEKYTTLPGYFDSEKGYVSATLRKYGPKEGGGISITYNSVVSGNFELEYDGGTYTIIFSLTLDDGSSKSFYFNGDLEFRDESSVPESATGAGSATFGLKAGKAR